MLIRSEYDIQFHLPAALSIVAMLRLHPSLDGAHREGESLSIEHIDLDTKRELEGHEYVDSFGNRCTRFSAPAGALRLAGSSLIEIEPTPDENGFGTDQHPVEGLPDEMLQYLLSSRYCEVDKLSQIACDLFASTAPGWMRAVTIRDWVHDHVKFNYQTARPTKTALDVFTERVGVCRDYQHLAITLTRAMNIPARYVTGYLGDMRVPYSGAGDFSAWYQVYLGGRWWTMDARHNTPRIGRVLMATGRDATDVAITTSFGNALLTHFYVESNEVDETGERVPLPLSPASADAGTAPETGSVAEPTGVSSIDE
ncbi:MAG: transglutaminase family protein [Edaphobacter sp.]|uniref:transglutaminase-like domain-containing protein n=1 Tax=Edaphobacter sp. TaxID=1934404 RepID=UPI002399D838|nr:transglutaminase family protein [Edaphobacter sp.]MDE1175967.1 transglutaminase family protein [Edaphobacter sp.]